MSKQVMRVWYAGRQDSTQQKVCASLPERLLGKHAAGGAAELAGLLHAGAGPHGATSERQGLCLTGRSPNGPGPSAPSDPLELSKL